MYGLIYSVENKINGRTYIGQTTIEWPKRKNAHIKNPSKYSVIDRAIKKYGKENFEWSIIDNADNQEVLNQLEKLHITRYESLTTQQGYNLREGGSNGKHSKESIKKMSEHKKGINHYLYNIKKEDHPLYGRTLSETHKNKISNSRKGQKWNLNSRKNMSKKRQGKYPGVTYKEKQINPWNRVWRSAIKINGKVKSLGFYEDPFTASLVYQLVWKEIYEA